MARLVRKTGDQLHLITVPRSLVWKHVWRAALPWQAAAREPLLHQQLVLHCQDLHPGWSRRLTARQSLRHCTVCSLTMAAYHYCLLHSLRRLLCFQVWQRLLHARLLLAACRPCNAHRLAVCRDLPHPTQKMYIQHMCACRPLRPPQP